MIQGSAADMMKSSLRKVHKYNNEVALDTHLILTIHDELKTETGIPDFRRYGKAYMQNVIALMMDTEGRVGVPMPVEASLCKHNWSVAEQKQEVWS